MDSTTLSIMDLLKAYDVELNRARESTARLSALRTIIRGLSGQGLSESEFRELSLRIESIGGKAVNDVDSGDVTEEIQSLNAELDKASKLRAKQEASLGETARWIENLRLEYQASDVEFSSLISYVKQLLDRAVTAGNRFEQLTQYAEIGLDEKLQDVMLRAMVAKDRIAEVVVAQEHEDRKKAEHSKLLVQLAENHRRELSAQEKMSRLRRTLEAVQAIRRDHSLTKIMSEFFSAHLSRINEIFQAIHSPREFADVIVRSEGLDNVGIQLKRQDGQVVDISQVSTGQRSALALSLFFALNEQLAHGPQLVLLDDPVANIDDLNVLAFFDYLREVALTRRRQIVYATANDRMAALFETKFSFLNGEYVRRTLSREQLTDASSG